MTNPVGTWQQIAAEAQGAFLGLGKFPLRAYSEFMPPPYVGLKPYAPDLKQAAATCAISDEHALDVDEYEQAHDLEPGLDWIASHLVDEIGKLMRGESHAFSRTALTGNPAWPAELAEAARKGQLADDPLVVIQPLALSRTQDDKGNERWTLFGASHEGTASVWHGLDVAQLGELIAWAGCDGEWRIFADRGELPEALRSRVLEPESGELAGLRAIVTFTPFTQLPAAIREAYLARTLELIPTPASLVFAEHPQYRKLAQQLPRAMQIPLLHLFPRIESACTIRIPQSGWLDEGDGGGQGHRVVGELVRSHRWQRRARDEDVGGDDAYTDKVSTALFSTDPKAVDLYDKPLARNSQIWTEDYQLLLDGPAADRKALEHAAKIVDRGGRYGYRMYYPPMRAGIREVFWHLPLVASKQRGRFREGPRGYVTAEAAGAPSIRLRAKLLERPLHLAAARLFPRDAGRPRHTTSINARKLLEMHAHLGAPMSASLARALVHLGKDVKLEDWLADLPACARERAAGARFASSLEAAIAGEEDVGQVHVIDKLGTRAFEEQIWASIYELSHGAFRQKNDADGISVNRGKHGGPAAKAAHVVAHEKRDLEALGDHLHARYRELIERTGMTGRAEVVDHVFRWETDFEFPWMEGWAKNQTGDHERNIVLVIPGANRNEAVIMGDHYDTAYMEDVFYPETGGDFLRAASRGADDNHSATTALLLAAEQLLPLARAGKLERDVWLVHLTGEEFPADSLGARALAQALVERSLAFTAEDGSRREMSHVEVVGAFILDMVGHNSDRDRDVFQIAPGEGAASARLARNAHRANLKWNRAAAEWNRAPDRHHANRAQRMPDAKEPPPLFAHLPLHGEIRDEWEPRSALFNTDGQCFSDLGIPVVLFMENYDISRKGYHDTHDTLENIDLDYCAALIAIAIETVAETAC
ncbi:MAG: hypothetical protein JWO36_7101 [Myxococcales bacterium]|nr:hypothetical protein [Myxococcales bacterium]